MRMPQAKARTTATTAAIRVKIVLLVAAGLVTAGYLGLRALANILEELMRD